MAQATADKAIVEWFRCRNSEGWRSSCDEFLPEQSSEHKCIFLVLADKLVQHVVDYYLNREN